MSSLFKLRLKDLFSAHKQSCLYYGVHTVTKFCYRNRHDDARFNHANIQMLSSSLQKQIFNGWPDKRPEDNVLRKVKDHLQIHDLWGKNSTAVDSIAFDLPKLYGRDLSEHFQNIAKQQTDSYVTHSDHISNILTKIPPVPKLWQFEAGWTKYDVNGSFEGVIAPDEDVLVFDVEVCLSAGNVPVLATAVSKHAWYCWISELLFDERSQAPRHISPSSMIPMVHNSKKQLIIGHNVAFDRAYIKEQYNLKKSDMAFLDTLSLHVCISGVTNAQRNYLNSKNRTTIYDWMEHGSTNSLMKVYEFYCGKTLDKSTRDLFVTGTLQDVRENFQECVRYCASDVVATHQVFEVLWPLFQQHAPNPVTLSGMLEMGTAYLPIDQSWKKYIDNADNMFNKITEDMKQSLMAVADDALEMLINEKYKDDPWLWNLDWSLHKTVLKCTDNIHVHQNFSSVQEYIDNITFNLSEKQRQRIQLAGYPKWYRDLCMTNKDPKYQRGPVNISSQTKVTPSLLRMTWDGYPLHHERKYGWGYLVPVPNFTHSSDQDKKFNFPYKQFLDVIELRKSTQELENKEAKVDIVHEIYKEDNKRHGIDIGIPGVLFYQLPHKDGEANNVGNPLAKDFLEKIEDGTLVSTGNYNAKQPIQMNKMLAFWRNGRKRIKSQLTVWMDDDDQKNTIGAILPQVITAGTVTRRAVEATWLTASNPLPDRIGSELKSMVRPPPGYCLVGADVDSQELWIASLLGDAQFAQIHGCTALSWMTLQGNKSEGTDLHSRTASTIGMSRDQAKVFNYGRVYGAGERFAVRLLMQFNHKLTASEAEKVAAKLYETTKGTRKYTLTNLGKSIAEDLNINVDPDGLIDYHDLKKILNLSEYSWESRDQIVDVNKVWHGGSESAMFNKLESIALSEEPRTPVLDCMITNALLPKHVHSHYKTSRVNWVVQSSAVDYLHLLLTCMKWLIEEYKIDARFSISIHDEVRYIVSEEDKYRAALALQISNLLTRSMFALKLDMHDLPQGVAFFSSVDIDKALRKEVDMDCVTPSNPDGLMKGHNIFPGESLSIQKLLQKTNGGRLDITSLNQATSN